MNKQRMMSSKIDKQNNISDIKYNGSTVKIPRFNIIQLSSFFHQRYSLDFFYIILKLQFGYTILTETTRKAINIAGRHLENIS